MHEFLNEFSHRASISQYERNNDAFKVLYAHLNEYKAKTSNCFRPYLYNNRFLAVKYLRLQNRSASPSLANQTIVAAMAASLVLPNHYNYETPQKYNSEINRLNSEGYKKSIYFAKIYSPISADQIINLYTRYNNTRQTYGDSLYNMAHLSARSSRSQSPNTIGLNLYEQNKRKIVFYQNSKKSALYETGVTPDAKKVLPPRSILFVSGNNQHEESSSQLPRYRRAYSRPDNGKFAYDKEYAIFTQTLQVASKYWIYANRIHRFNENSHQRSYFGAEQRYAQQNYQNIEGILRFTAEEIYHQFTSNQNSYTKSYSSELDNAAANFSKPLYSFRNTQRIRNMSFYQQYKRYRDMKNYLRITDKNFAKTYSIIYRTVPLSVPVFVEKTFAYEFKHILRTGN